MKRKLVKQGAATMMISLPSKWIRENKLGKGDEVDLIEKNNLLTIGAEIQSKQDLLIDIDKENQKDIKNLLTHAYRRGFDKIILKGDLGQLKLIREITNDLLLGVELTEISSNRITIENISEPKEQKYEIILKKIFEIIEETAEITTNDFKENKLTNFQEIEELKKQQERFVLYCRRLLSKGNTGKNKMLHWELLTFLLHIEHLYYYLYRYAAGNKIQNKDIQKLLTNLKDYITLYKDAYLNKNIKAVHEINNLKKDYYLGACIKALEKSSGKATVILTYIRELFRITQIGTSPILMDLLENHSKETY